MSNRFSTLSVVGTLILTAALADDCEVGEPPPTFEDDSRACEAFITEDPDNLWPNLGMSWSVTKPEMCPIGLQDPGELVVFEGVVTAEDVEATSVASGGLTFFDAFGAPVSSEGTLCQFSLNAQEGVTECKTSNALYEAGTAGELSDSTQMRDVAEFRADNIQAGATFVEAEFNLPYTFDTQAVAEGPMSVQSYTGFSVTADVINGRQPLDYEWIYSDSESSTWWDVGGNSATLDMSSGMPDGLYTYKVIVTDADGDVDTTWHQVGVNAPDGDPGGGGDDPCLICDF